MYLENRLISAQIHVTLLNALYCFSISLLKECQACDKVYTEDSLVPNLLVFPPAMALSHLSVYKSMHLVLQGKVHVVSVPKLHKMATES